MLRRLPLHPRLWYGFGAVAVGGACVSSVFILMAAPPHFPFIPTQSFEPAVTNPTLLVSNPLSFTAVAYTLLAGWLFTRPKRELNLPEAGSKPRRKLRDALLRRKARMSLRRRKQLEQRRKTKSARKRAGPLWMKRPLLRHGRPNYRPE
ncbi:MAG: hypothetical protein AAF581_14220 [Planctomycetota bacterium]